MVIENFYRYLILSKLPDEPGPKLIKTGIAALAPVPVRIQSKNGRLSVDKICPGESYVPPPIASKPLADLWAQ
jgi:hypothetical protein